MCDGLVVCVVMVLVVLFLCVFDGVVKCGCGVSRGTDAASTTTRERRV